MQAIQATPAITRLHLLKPVILAVIWRSQNAWHGDEHPTYQRAMEARVNNELQKIIA